MILLGHPSGCTWSVQPKGRGIGGSPMPRVQDYQCSVEGCNNRSTARGLCHKHYERQRLHRRLSLLPSRTTAERFWAKVDRLEGTDDCWLWRGYISPSGYGRFTYGDLGHLAHRFAYEDHIGPIPTGLTLDHLCRNPACVRPDHLEPVSNAENIQRAAQARTHCIRGHAYVDGNIYTRPSTGRRECRTCKRTNMKILVERRKNDRRQRNAHARPT